MTTSRNRFVFSCIFFYLAVQGVHSLSCLHPKAIAEEEDKRQQLLLEHDREWKRGHDFQNEGELLGAEGCAQRCVQIDYLLFDEPHERIVASIEWAAMIFENEHDFLRAENAWAKAMEQKIKLYGPTDWRVIDSKVALRRVRLLLEFDEEQLSKLKALQVKEWRALQFLTNGKIEEAIELEEELIAERKVIYGEESIEVANMAINLGDAKSALKKYEQAIMHYEHARKIFNNNLGEVHPKVADLLINEAQVYQDSGNAKLAQELATNATEILNKIESAEKSKNVTPRADE